MDFTPTAQSLGDSEIANEIEAVDPRAVEELWGGAVTAASGFVALPMCLLRLQSKLRLSPTDLVVMSNLLAHRWKASDAVFPRTTTIANRMGVTPRTVQRSAEKMIKAGLMERVKLANGMRAYRFDLLNKLLSREVAASLQIKSLESLDA